MIDNFVDYYTYIVSDAWYKLTEPIRKRNGGVCECCFMRYGEVVHHRTYKNLGHEKEDELLHVCNKCHEQIHKKGVYFIWPSRRAFLQLLQEEATFNHHLQTERKEQLPF